MSASVIGHTDWKLSSDDKGHRTYNIEYLVETTTNLDGPAVVFNTAGLPTVGSTWSPGNDLDPWAFCAPNWTVSRISKDPGLQRWWYVNIPFTTIPLERCQTTTIENPLLEPAEVSGSFVKYTREALEDRNGDLLISSSHERYRGKAVERDDNRPTVRVSMNVGTLPLALATGMVDNVNDSPMWGLTERMVKLSNMSWQRKLYGVCTYYYTITYDFDINFKTFDRVLPDEGNLVLRAGGNKLNPEDFEVPKDKRFENKKGPFLLDGNGNLNLNPEAPVYNTFELYEESNLLLLGLPTSF